MTRERICVGVLEKENRLNSLTYNIVFFYILRIGLAVSILIQKLKKKITKIISFQDF